MGSSFFGCLSTFGASLVSATDADDSDVPSSSDELSELDSSELSESEMSFSYMIAPLARQPSDDPF